MFTPAKKSAVYLKLAITGASGSGKTFSALRLARGLVGPNGKIALIDTENGSASLYSDRFAFDVCDVQPPYDMDKFVQPIRDAEKAGYDCVIIDSASHFWEGILAWKDKLDERGGSGFANWSKAGAKFKDIIAAVLQSKIHVIACMRSKMDYVLEQNDKGKMVPRKVGLAPIMRDGIEYEFTTVLDVDMAHMAQASKDRTGLFRDAIFQISEDTGAALKGWLTQADAPAVKTAEAPAPKPAEAPAEATAEAPSLKPPPKTPAPPPMQDVQDLVGAEDVEKLELYLRTLHKEEGPACKWASEGRVDKIALLYDKEAQDLITYCQRKMNGGVLDTDVDPPAVPDVLPAELNWVDDADKAIAYCKRVNWWPLSPERVAKINEKRAAFCRAAGLKDKEVA